jgi:hypothetical protein
MPRIKPPAQYGLVAKVIKRTQKKFCVVVIEAETEVFEAILFPYLLAPTILNFSARANLQLPNIRCAICRFNP